MKENLNIPIFYYICDKNMRRYIMADKKNPTFLYSLMLYNYKCFKGVNKFLFGNRWNNHKVYIPQCTVFLGNNGTGKTNILKAIANTAPKKREITDKEMKRGYTSDVPELYQSTLSGGINKNRGATTVHYPDVIERNINPGYNVSSEFACYRGNENSIFKERLSVLGKKGKAIDHITKEEVDAYECASIGYSDQFNYVSYDNSELNNLKIYAYGTNRFSDTQRNLDSSKSVDTLFLDNSPLINVEEWLLQMEMAQMREVGNAGDKIKIIKNILKTSDLFPEIIDYSIHTDKNYNSEILFKTAEGNFKLRDLGYGYQCMFAWVFDFMKKLFDRYPKSKNPLAEPAVLLIDEIDLHLHPQWQRHVIKDLCKLFPNTQLIVTTHSPLVIQSIDNINLFILSKEDDHTKVTHCTEETYQGWTIEEILRELMDLGDGIRPREYQKLRDDFEYAMNRGDLEKGKKAYDELKKILHPQNVENELLDIDLGQLKAMQDD